jgi:class 3 adenylate cyclase/tetratricopeptide (TPR) repeat protein
MRCSKCGSENREGRKFCTKCGTPLLAACPKCGAAVEPDESFCGECGTALGNAAPPAVADGTQSVTASAGGERRHLTILFCDLVGSTEISARLDPEEWRELVDGYHRAAAEAITRFGGHVAKYLGDGVMAFFGYPEAHDNDAERAARAGLAILDGVAKLNESYPSQPKLSVRIGIDSGSVVVGTGAGQAIDVFGDAANIAARVQGAATPDTIVVTAATHRLIPGLFMVENRGTQALKGIEQPVQLYQIIRPSGMRGRLAAAAAAGALTPFVGRQDELRLLMSRWERAREGEGQVVTIVGEAGIGKSRLVQEFHDRIAADRHTWLECATAAFFQNTPFYAVAEMLRESFHWHNNQNDEQRLAALETALATTGVELGTAVPLIASLLDMPLGDKYPPLTMPPDQQRKRLLGTLVAWTIGAARTQPLVIATEDLHWADPSTLEVTQLLVEQGVNAPLLLIYTARPEFRESWSTRAHHTQITLNRLDVRDIRVLVAQLASSKALPDQTVAGVVERSGGVPLFVEELVRAVLESSEEKLSGSAIPVTLHDSLMARIDRLGPVKEVLQVGSVLGSEFSYGLLQALHPVSDEQLHRELRRLTDSDLLYVRGIALEATYQFKHALIRDAAYEALLKSLRKELHRLVAQTINDKFPVIKQTRPEVLARHWTESGEIEAAIVEWQQAGEKAVERRAYREAENHYSEAILNLQTLSPSQEHDTQELNLDLAMGAVMGATRGWSAPETIGLYTKARSLAERGGSAESLDLFNGLWIAALTRGELRLAQALADQLLSIASNKGNLPIARVLAHNAQGQTRHLLGDLIGARSHFSWAIENYCEEDFRGSLFDAGFGSLAWSGPNEWQLGYPDLALQYTENALSVARRGGNPFAVAIAVGIGTQVYGLRGDFKRTLEAAQEAVQLGETLGFPLWTAIGKIVGAWARARMGEVNDAPDQIQEGLAALKNIGFHELLSRFLTLLCEVQALAGLVDAAFLTAEQALEANPDELLYRPYTLRLRGELNSKLCSAEGSRLTLPEQDFREGIRIARLMSGKSEELRASISLAKLLRDMDRGAEARAMLGEIYNWFTEGFDTADLKEAKALLDELAS